MYNLTLGLLVCIVLWIFMSTKGRGYKVEISTYKFSTKVMEFDP